MPLGGNLLALPFADASIGSLSCLHVAEHVGLGRYGDPLDPLGTRKAAAELARVLAPGGDLYVALPVGRPRVCFNAHRIHAARDVRAYFGALDLSEFAGVGDDGALVESAPLDLFDDASYACGLFRFRRPR
jgi:SAM-dependent methyltransferase